LNDARTGVGGNLDGFSLGGVTTSTIGFGFQKSNVVLDIFLSKLLAFLAPSNSVTNSHFSDIIAIIAFAAAMKFTTIVLAALSVGPALAFT
jgi:hypothetical protein